MPGLQSTASLLVETDFVLVGYACAATDGESLRLQHHALAVEGCGRILAEPVALHPRSARLDTILDELRPGDTLVVCRLEVLAGSLEELVDCAVTLRVRNVGLRSLAERIDTDAPDGDLIYDMFGVLAAFTPAVNRYGERPTAVSARRPFPSQSGAVGDVVIAPRPRTRSRHERTSIAARKQMGALET
ncbi:MAG: recombinase family protein [Gammaproteobacteria bacterium]|nr:recombinase family protein [Gammaproteobacteria bacterium]